MRNKTSRFNHTSAFVHSITPVLSFVAKSIVMTVGLQLLGVPVKECCHESDFARLTSCRAEIGHHPVRSNEQGRLPARCQLAPKSSPRGPTVGPRQCAPLGPPRSRAGTPTQRFLVDSSLDLARGNAAAVQLRAVAAYDCHPPRAGSYERQWWSVARLCSRRQNGLWGRLRHHDGRQRSTRNY